MRRAVFHGEGRITVEDAPMPEPGSGELLVRVYACALCGSDRGLWQDGNKTTPGHETAGIVVAVGPGAATPAGTFGAVFLVAYCGRCALCLAGSRGACLTKEAMLGFNRDGGFAEYVTVPERCFLPLNPGLHPDNAVMLLDVVGTAMHAWRRSGYADDPPAAALVVGAGPIGLGCVLTLRAVDVPEVVAVDVAPYRLELAGRLGATVVEGGEGAVDRVRTLLPDGGAPLVIEASGHPLAQRQALDLLAPGGKLVLVGHSRRPLEVWGSRDLIAPEKTMLGSEYFDNREFEANQALILNGTLDPTRTITHRFPLDEIEEAYRQFWGGETGKVLIYPNGVPEGFDTGTLG